MVKTFLQSEKEDKRFVDIFICHLSSDEKMSVKGGKLFVLEGEELMRQGVRGICEGHDKDTLGIC